ncbi:MAG TPA: ABC transporter ATP-binding protein [Bryobacteraceae bacterium]|nr:ABC transporter ATP-binding protein [Bryobacteraceae bacterium]
MKLEVPDGEILGLVGESGSGKSTFALALLGLLGHTGAKISGRILLNGIDVLPYSERQMRDVRGRLISLIPQGASGALNPALRIGTQIREAWKAHSQESWKTESRRVKELLASCGLPDDEAFLRRFPGQVSVGQAQRILIVMALLHRPALLVADEPTSALDVITQQEVLDLIAKINRQHGMSVLFISHDLRSVAALCGGVAILHEGKIVECGPVTGVLAAPQHPYTKRLVAAAEKLQLSPSGGMRAGSPEIQSPPRLP